MKLRYSISTILLLTALPAAYFAGRIPLLQRTQKAERLAVKAQSDLEAFMLHSEIRIDSNAWYHLNEIRSNVEDSPFWIDKSVGPPLSVADAYVVCESIIKNLESESSLTNIKRWHVESLALISLDWGPEEDDPQRWIYSARFIGFEDNSPESTSFVAILFMDGTVFVGSKDLEPELYDVIRRLYPSR